MRALVDVPFSASRERLRPYYEQNAVSIDTIRAAAGVDPEAILRVARTLHYNPWAWSSRLAWNGLPTYDQLTVACNFVWELTGYRGLQHGASSGRQLATRLSLMQSYRGEIGHLVVQQMGFSDMEANDAIEDVLDFLRHWTGHIFPRFLMVLESIAADVFSRYDLPVGSYGYYASSVEAQFQLPVLTTLEEYGLPAPLAERLLQLLPRSEVNGALDEILASLRRLGKIAGLSVFEQEIVDDFLSGL
jgi:hypothetical protein